MSTQGSIYKDTFSLDQKADVPIESVIKGIMEGKWKDKIEALRSAPEEQYTKLKELLPAVTFSGTFKNRTDTGLDQYSGIVVLDIDHLDYAQLMMLIEALRDKPIIYFAFISPGGKGLKILIKVNTGPEHHIAAFNHIKHDFENSFAVSVDPSGKNISRLCYVSYDSTAIFNPEAAIYQVDVEAYGEKKKEYTPPVTDAAAVTEADKIYKLCVKWVENKFSYNAGGRNNYIHALACAMNRCGVERDTTLDIVYRNYDLPQKELYKCVKSAYHHNQAQFNTVEVKDIGVEEFVAPAYVAEYTDDIVTNDIMRITAMLYHHKVPEKEIKDVVAKVAKYYRGEGKLDISKSDLFALMTSAIASLNQKVAEVSSQNTLTYKTAEEIGMDIFSNGGSANAIPTKIPIIDTATRGGLVPGNFYGVIGHGETYKSILVQWISEEAAMDNTAVLYLNGEMSARQFSGRMIQKTLHLNIYNELAMGRITQEKMPELMAQAGEMLKGNLFVVSSIGFEKDNILATIDNIKVTTGKTVKMVIIDGITQMNNERLEEIPGTIKNSFKCKDIAKTAHAGEGVVVIGLLHISGDKTKSYRDTGSIVRGGQKVIANMDGYFSTSRLIDPKTNDLANEDILYLENKFYLRFRDKRGDGGEVNCIVNVTENLDLQMEETNPSSYEVKIMKAIS